MLRSYREIEDQVLRLQRRTVVVPAAANSCVLEAALEARKRKLADFILIDSKERLSAVFGELGVGGDVLDDFDVVEEEDCLKAARLGVDMVREGRADLIAKGRLQTFELMKAVLDKQRGLREEKSLLSDVMLIEQPRAPEPRLIAMTDPALCVAPTDDELVRIAGNCLLLMKRLGCVKPRIAFLAALEVVKETMPATLSAARAAEMFALTFGDQVVAQGPLSFDVACSRRAAEVKGSAGPVAGDADVLVVPNIEAGNILAKTIAVFTDAEYGHLVLGARVPVVMSSRSDSSSSKFNSLLLGLLCS